MNISKTTAISLIFIFCLSAPIYAHRVNIFAWVEGDRVFTQSKFSGGKRVRFGDVVVSDLKGNKLLTGKTNDKGEFSFKVPAKTALRIEILAGMGHRGEWTISTKELSEKHDQQIPEIPTAITSLPDSPNPEQKVHNDVRYDPKDLEPMLNRILEKRLRPIQESLAELKNRGTSITDIIAGLGYIMGIVGIGSYLRSKQKNG